MYIYRGTRPQCLDREDSERSVGVYSSASLSGENIGTTVRRLNSKNNFNGVRNGLFSIFFIHERRRECLECLAGIIRDGVA
jgi:hypothetical protein